MFADSDGLELWLTHTLRDEQAAVVERLQDGIEKHLEQHHQKLVGIMMSRLSCMSAPRRPVPRLQPASVHRLPPPSTPRGAPQEASQAPPEDDLRQMLSARPDWLDSHESPLSLDGTASLPRLDSRLSSAARIEASRAETLIEASKNFVVEKEHKTEELERGCFLANFVRSNQFEWMSASLIFLCTLIMIVEIQYDGLNIGYELEIVYFDGPASWPVNGRMFRTIDVVFNCLFSAELLLRLTVFRAQALKSGWTWFDGTLILIGFLDSVSLLKFGGVNPMVLRVARLARMLRLIEVLRTVRAFETLFLLVRSIKCSLGALFWSFMFLWIAQIATGIVVCQLLKGFLLDEEADLEVRRQVFTYFGTFLASIVTMFEITLANWIVVTRLLHTHVSQMWGVFFIVYRGCIMFAVMKVITAVFIAETTKGLNQDNSFAIQKKQREKEAYCRKLKEVFGGLDEDGSGWLSREEFEPLISDELLKSWLATLDIDVLDLEDLFELLQNARGEIHIEEFTWGMGKLKGFAKSIDVLKLLKKVAELENTLQRQRKAEAANRARETEQEHESTLGGLVEVLSYYTEETNSKLDEVLLSLAGPRGTGPIGDVTERPLLPLSGNSLVSPCSL